MNLPKSFKKKYPDMINEVDRIMYIRESLYFNIDIKTKPLGILIEHQGYCGWSVCHEKDKWDVNYGILKAIYRLRIGKTVKQKLEEINKKIIEVKEKNETVNLIKYYNKLLYSQAGLQIIQLYNKKH